MSRIAKLPIELPGGVEVNITDAAVNAKGPKGEGRLPLLPGVRVEQQDNTLRIHAQPTHPRGAAMSGTARTLVYNLIYGVSQGFEKRLTIVGVGYRAQAQGDKLNLTLGFSHPVVYQAPAGIKIETPSQTEIIVRGADKQKVGQVAAEIRAYRPPEPYKGKGIRHADEHVRRKQAKKK